VTLLKSLKAQVKLLIAMGIGFCAGLSVKYIFNNQEPTIFANASTTNIFTFFISILILGTAFRWLTSENNEAISE